MSETRVRLLIRQHQDEKNSRKAHPWQMRCRTHVAPKYNPPGPSSADTLAGADRIMAADSIGTMERRPAWVTDLEKAYDHEDILSLDRSKSNFDGQSLANVLFTANFLERRQHILDILKIEPVFEKSRNHYLGPVEKLQVAIQRGNRLRQLRAQYAWSDDDYQIAADLIGEPDPYGLHASLFLLTLRSQGSPEQHEQFLEKAEQWEYIGCYAQTELGHGSNVRGLETTATWNGDDSTFIIHSPTLTASKWWIGSLGKAATHAIVMAQLVIKEKTFGPHLFIVQVRDLDSHQTVPNVHIGDVGPKLGYNTMDTAYMLFNRLKVPHGAMLSRFSYIEPQTGDYQRKGSPTSAYATMTHVRSVIVQRAGAALARGVTIATRYFAIRRQFSDQDNPIKPELQVLDYSTVQMRLLPLIATMFALHITGGAMIAAHDSKHSVEASNRLADLHATSCGLKALATTLTADGLETCRRACGGQGYSSFSGIGTWWADYVPAVTWEGDNYIVGQQVGRHLLKTARSVVKGGHVSNDSADILVDFSSRREHYIPVSVADDSLEAIVQAFALCAAYLTFAALKRIDEEKCAWNSMLVDIWRLNNAYSEYLVVKNFHTWLNGLAEHSDVDVVTKAVLQGLFRLFALSSLEARAIDFLSSRVVEFAQIEKVRNQGIPTLLAQIRPHALKLVDAWMFDDWQLDSSLGRQDGRVYEELFRRASTDNPRNEVNFKPRLA